MIFTRDRLKMLGLVLLCASLSIAIVLPAIGIQKVQRDGFLSGNVPSETNIGHPDRRELTNVPVWLMMAGTGVLGFGFWILADILPASEGRKKGERNRA